MGQSESVPPANPPISEEERRKLAERKDVARRIAYWRERAGMRPIELAKASGLSPSQISRYEAALGSPGQVNLGRIVAACGIDRRMFWSPIDFGEGE
jgi:transcriptional regulator with XRE-family HTH domain